MEPAPLGAPQRPLVCAEGWARFEERARRRRIDRRAEAARHAIARRSPEEAAAAIDEIRELDPDAPEIVSLVGELHAATIAPAVADHANRGARIAAVAAFAVVLLAAPWREETQPLLSYPVWISDALIASAAPALLPARAASEPVAAEPTGTAGAAAATTGVARGRNEPLKPVEPNPIEAPPAAPLPPAFVADTTAETEPPAAVVDRGPGPASNAAAAPQAPDDEALIRRVLVRYQAAYDRLDAQSARAVWPSVNERALARAFDELDSQRITFDACDIRPAGEAATATCRGTARYVARVGSREPRVEPRVWTFALRKVGSDWTIDAARTER